MSDLSQRYLTNFITDILKHFLKKSEFKSNTFFYDIPMFVTATGKNFNIHLSARVPLKNFGLKEEHLLERGRLSEGSAY